MIKVKAFAVNPFREVTYLVIDEATKKAVVVDSGLMTQLEIERFDDYVSRHEVDIILAINTHLHVDHIIGVSYIMDKYGVQFAASKQDEPLFKASRKSAVMFDMSPALPFVNSVDIDLDEQKIISFGESELEVIATPGHTKGGVVFFHRDSKTLFTGDTLFKGSIGRTDLLGGDYDELMNSIIGNILPLGGDVTIYPGHGDHSTLTEEVTHNPFISEVLKGEVNYSK